METALPKPEPIRVACPKCAAALKAPASAAGKTLKCPKCGGGVPVPLEVELDDGPDLRIVDDAPGSPAPAAPAPPVASHRAGRLFDKPDAPPPSFYKSLNTAFLYPVSGIAGILFLAFMAPIWSFTRILPMGIFTWPARIVVAGYVAAYVWNVLYDTSMGKHRAPGWPDAMDFGELFLNALRFFGATFIAFLPSIALLMHVAFQGDGEISWERDRSELIVAGVLALVGVLYYPMTLMLIGFGESLWAPVNVVFGVRSILRIWKPYLVTVLYFAATFLGAGALEYELGEWVEGQGILMGVAAFGFMTFVELYLNILQIRVLGLLYLCNKDRLGWFR